jgi:hypothetical protein
MGSPLRQYGNIKNTCKSMLCCQATREMRLQDGKSQPDRHRVIQKEGSLEEMMATEGLETERRCVANA